MEWKLLDLLIPALIASFVTCEIFLWVLAVDFLISSGFFCHLNTTQAIFK